MRSEHTCDLCLAEAQGSQAHLGSRLLLSHVNKCGISLLGDKQFPPTSLFIKQGNVTNVVASERHKSQQLMHFLAKGSRETLGMILCQNSIDNNYSCISQEECREDSQLEPAAGCQCNATLSNPFLERCIHFYCPTTPTEGREQMYCSCVLGIRHLSGFTAAKWCHSFLSVFCLCCAWYLEQIESQNHRIISLLWNLKNKLFFPSFFRCKPCRHSQLNYLPGAAFPVQRDNWDISHGGTALFHIPIVGSPLGDLALFPSADYKNSLISSDSIIYRWNLLPGSQRSV